MRCRVTRLLALFAALLALCVLAPRAWAGEAASEMPPRDVSVMVQPSAVRLPPAPADFQRIDRGWLVVELPASVRDRVEAVAVEADAFRTRLGEDFGQDVLDHVLVRVARNPEQMAELAPEGAPPPAYAAGVAYPAIHLVLLALQAPETWEAPDLTELLEHELTHVALADAVGGHHRPRWFDEGLAIHESDELPWARTKTLWGASIGHRLIPLAELDRGFPSDGYEVTLAYAESADFMRFLMRDEDRARFGSLVQRVRAGAAFDRALEDAYGTDVRKLEYEWHEELGRRFSVVPMLTGGGAVWTLMVGLAAVAWVKKRRRAKAKLAEWAREEAEAEAAMAVARERAVVVQPEVEEEPLPQRVPSGVPIVEHEGRWYTVH
jgi:hypothetical protein